MSKFNEYVEMINANTVAYDGEGYDPQIRDKIVKAAKKLIKNDKKELMKKVIKDIVNKAAEGINGATEDDKKSAIDYLISLYIISG